MRSKGGGERGQDAPSSPPTGPGLSAESTASCLLSQGSSDPERKIEWTYIWKIGGCWSVPPLAGPKRKGATSHGRLDDVAQVAVIVRKVEGRIAVVVLAIGEAKLRADAMQLEFCQVNDGLIDPVSKNIRQRITYPNAPLPACPCSG